MATRSARRKAPRKAPRKTPGRTSEKALHKPLRKVAPEHGDAIRIVPLHPQAGAEIVAQAAAPQLTYRNGPLMTSVEVFTVFWGAAWNSAPQSAMMPELNNFFDFVEERADRSACRIQCGELQDHARQAHRHHGADFTGTGNVRAGQRDSEDAAG